MRTLRKGDWQRLLKLFLTIIVGVAHTYYLVKEHTHERRVTLPVVDLSIVRMDMKEQGILRVQRCLTLHVF